MDSARYQDPIGRLEDSAERRRGNESKPRGQPSLITTTICADPTSTWTTSEIRSPD